MKIKWTRTHLWLFISFITLALVFYLAGYFMFVSPMQNKLREAEEKLSVQQQLLTNTDLDDDRLNRITTELQVKLPIERATDQVLLLLSETAQATNSSITKISFNRSDITDDITSKVEAISATSYQLQITSPDFHHMHRFLEQIENLERLTNINHYQFTQGTTDRISFSLSFTTYHSPSLTQLKIESPSFDH